MISLLFRLNFFAESRRKNRAKAEIYIFGLATVDGTGFLRRRFFPTRMPAQTTHSQILGHGSGVLWLTGLSGAGKTTLALAACEQLRAKRIFATVVDGDVLRVGLSKDLGFSLEARRENVRRAAELAVVLADVGLLVIVALFSPLRVDRAAAAERLRGKAVPFAEVFVNAPLSVCEERDPKGLYRKARAGVLKDFTGIDSRYEEPEQPDLELCTDREKAEQSVDKLVALALRLAVADGSG